MNPDERLTVDEVSEHDWFKHAGNTPETPLATPTVLSLAAGDFGLFLALKIAFAQVKHSTKPSTPS